jgi:hypothetical protein
VSEQTEEINIIGFREFARSRCITANRAAARLFAQWILNNLAGADQEVTEQAYEPDLLTETENPNPQKEQTQ